MTKKLPIILGLAFAIALPSTAEGATRVKMYRTKRGTVVQASHRSKADKSKMNNYSSKGNSNPYTGKKGTK